MIRSMLLVFMVLVAVPTDAPAQPAPQDLLQRYESTFTPFRRVTFKVQLTRDFFGAAQADGPSRRIESSTSVWRDGDRWKILVTESESEKEQGKWQTERSGAERVYPAKGMMAVSINPDGSARGMLARLRDLTAEERTSSELFEYGPVITGRYFLSRDPLPEILKKSELTANQVQFEGKSHWLLQSKGEWGSYSLWLDPDRGYVARRIIEIRERADKVYLGAGKVVTIATAPANRGGPWKQLRRQFDASRIDIIDGNHVVTEWTLTQDLTDSTNQLRVQKDFVRLSDVNLNPDFAEDPFKVTTPIPDGMHVSVKDQPGIEFEWRGGQIVKTVDHASVARVEGNWFRPARSSAAAS